MKRFLHRIFIIALALLEIPPAQSQPPSLDGPRTLPASTLIPHYRLPVTYNSTTVLVFPTPVRPVDRGDRDVLAQKQPGADNVLKLKAARRNFPPTNLHVFTADGRLYAFDVIYTDSLAATYDLTRLANPFPANPVVWSPGGVGVVPSSGLAGSRSLVQLTGEALNDGQMTACLKAIRAQRSNFAISTKHYQMRLRLDNIDRGGPLLFLRFSLSNHSNLEYVPDFLRLYVRDQTRAKRTSRQELEITPTYADTLPAIPGRATREFIIAIPRMTIPDRKEFRVELYEKNGGRSLSLRINNRALLRSRAIPFP